MDLLNFAYHHALAPFLSDETLEMELRIHQRQMEIFWTTSPALSRGYFPAETCFSERLIPILKKVGIQWSIVANTHLSSAGDRQRLELERALAFAESHADPGTAVVLAGDFNLRGVVLAGFSHPGPGIDHVLVRGATAAQLVVWPQERRRQNGLVLSDHAPVELLVR